jgi:PEP-CTERM motif
VKKRLQLILAGSMLLPGSTGVLLAANAHCRSWVTQAATETAETVVAKKRHYSKKVLAAWAVWRAKHPNAKPVRRTPVLRPGSFMSAKVPDVLGFYCDVSVSTVDEAIATILQPVEAVTTTGPPDAAVDSTDSPGPFTLIADDPAPGDTSTSAWPPMFSSPTGYGSAPVAPPSGTPPSDDPPTTGSSVPPSTPTPPAAVAAEPSSLLLLGTGIVAAAGLFRRRKLQS